MSNNPENRKHKRIERQYTARFRIRSDKASEAKSEDWDSITLMNISTGGTLFYYTKDLGIGTLLDLQIDVSKFTPGLNCIGKIIRIYEIESTSVFGTAVKFIDIGVKEEAMINAIVE